MRTGFHYPAKFVKHPETAKGPITTFQIGTQDKNTHKWTNYKIVVWGNIPIEEGEKIEIKSIMGVDMNEFTDKEGVTHLECQIIATVAKDEGLPNDI
jgi:hypothetical protein